MQSVADLIDEAVKLCKTKRALASRLGVTEQTIQGIYAGRRHLNVYQAAELAELLGKDFRDVWAVVTINHETDPERKSRLSEAFFRRAILGAVAAFGLIGGLPEAKATEKTSQELTSLYIVAALAWLHRAVRGRLRAHLARALDRRHTPRPHMIARPHDA